MRMGTVYAAGRGPHRKVVQAGRMGLELDDRGAPRIDGTESSASCKAITDA